MNRLLVTTTTSKESTIDKVPESSTLSVESLLVVVTNHSLRLLLIKITTS